MRFLIISRDGRSLGLARKLEKEGHAVNAHIVSPSCQGKGTGIVSVVKTPRPIVDAEGVYNISAIEHLMSTARPDITIFDTPDMPTMVDRMTRAGHRAIGAASNAPAYFVGGAATDPCSIYFEAWFNGVHFVAPYAIHHVYHRMMTGEAGASLTGGSGFISIFVPGISRIMRYMNDQVHALRAANYRGPVQLGFTSALGVPQSLHCGFQPMTFSLFESIYGSLGQFLNSIATAAPVESRTISDVVAGVRLSVAPFPYTKPPRSPLPVEGINDGNLKHLWFNDLAATSGGQYQTTGESNDLGFVTARGEYVREAVRRVYRTINNLSGTPNLQYRTDIGDDVSAIRSIGGDECAPTAKRTSSSSTSKMPQTSATPGGPSSKTS